MAEVFAPELSPGGGWGLSEPSEATMQAAEAQAPGEGVSLSYHTYADPDTDAGRRLNGAAPVVLRQSETAHGLAWAELPDDWTGGTVTVTARGRYTGAPGLGLINLLGYVDPADGHKCCLDWPQDLVKPAGEWVFYARLSRNGLVDVTSGVLVSILPDVA